MFIRNQIKKHKPQLWTSCGISGDTESVSQQFTMQNATENERLVFRPMRFAVAARMWRTSPGIPGLCLVKRAILAAYSLRLISLLSAQRAIDATRSWEA
jgi:hypothetical protein